MSTGDKIDDVKDWLYKDLEGVFDTFPKYHMTALLGDFSGKVGREDIFRRRIGNEMLPEIRNGNGVRAVNFITSKNITVNSAMFVHCNITWTPPDGKNTTRLTIFSYTGD
jgi:hypothetical protein